MQSKHSRPTPTAKMQVEREQARQPLLEAYNTGQMASQSTSHGGQQRRPNQRTNKTWAASSTCPRRYRSSQRIWPIQRTRKDTLNSRRNTTENSWSKFWSQMESRRYSFLLLLSLHTSTILAEETTQASFEQLSNLDSGGRWVTTTTGKTTTSSGLNGSQTRSLVASNHTERCRNRSRRSRTKRGAHSRPEEGTSTASCPPRPPTRKAPLRRKISSPLPRRTSWPRHLLETPAQSFNSRNSIQRRRIIVRLRIAKLLAEERKPKTRRRRRRRTWPRITYCSIAKWKIITTWATKRQYTTIWRCTTRQ